LGIVFLPVKTVVKSPLMTDFEKRVLREALKIPLGETRSYQWLAKKCGKPKAVRAAANALAKNPWPLLVPCHRVTALNGPGGYNLGKGLKKGLLGLEKKIIRELNG